MSKGFKNKTDVFPGDKKREIPSMTTSTVTARRKGDPEHYAERIKGTHAKPGRGIQGANAEPERGVQDAASIRES